MSSSYKDINRGLSKIGIEKRGYATNYLRALQNLEQFTAMMKGINKFDFSVLKDQTYLEIIENLKKNNKINGFFFNCLDIRKNEKSETNMTGIKLQDFYNQYINELFKVSSAKVVSEYKDELIKIIENDLKLEGGRAFQYHRQTFLLNCEVCSILHKDLSDIQKLDELYGYLRKNNMKFDLGYNTLLGEKIKNLLADVAKEDKDFSAYFKQYVVETDLNQVVVQAMPNIQDQDEKKEENCLVI